jgi:hypothetical protein
VSKSRYISDIHDDDLGRLELMSPRQGRRVIRAAPKPTVDTLCAELARVRYWGAGPRLGRLGYDDLPGIVEIAVKRKVEDTTSLQAMVVPVVIDAVARLVPRNSREAAAALFGLDPDPPFYRSFVRVPVPTRRQAAAALLGHKASYFERYLEDGLLREMAQRLMAIYKEYP